MHRATYAGLAGLLTGVREPEERYLLIDDGMYAANYLRCFMLDAALTDHLVRPSRRRLVAFSAMLARRSSERGIGGRSGQPSRWLRISGMIRSTGDRSCVRFGPSSSAR